MALNQPNDMTEAELAKFYESRKGDTSLWKKTPKPMRRRRGDGPTTSFAVRLTPEEIEELQTAAETRHTTLSDFIRSSAIAAAREGSSSVAQRQAADEVRAKLRDLIESASRL